MDEATFKERTRKFGLAVIHLVDSLPHSKTADVIGRQILRSATSVGANYRTAYRAKSSPDMLNKLKIVEEEADETLYWLELLQEAKIAPEITLSPLLKEGDELVAMTVASIKTLHSKIQSSKP
jgi:four helix bundle protein